MCLIEWWKLKVCYGVHRNIPSKFILFLWHNILIYFDAAGPNTLQFFYSVCCYAQVIVLPHPSFCSNKQTEKKKKICFELSKSFDVAVLSSDMLQQSLSCHNLGTKLYNKLQNYLKNSRIWNFLKNNLNHFYCNRPFIQWMNIYPTYRQPNHQYTEMYKWHNP